MAMNGQQPSSNLQFLQNTSFTLEEEEQMRDEFLLQAELAEELKTAFDDFPDFDTSFDPDTTDDKHYLSASHKGNDGQADDLTKYTQPDNIISSKEPTISSSCSSDHLSFSLRHAQTSGMTLMTSIEHHQHHRNSTAEQSIVKQIVSGEEEKKLSRHIGDKQRVQTLCTEGEQVKPPFPQSDTSGSNGSVELSNAKDTTQSVDHDLAFSGLNSLIEEDKDLKELPENVKQLEDEWREEELSESKIKEMKNYISRVLQEKYKKEVRYMSQQYKKCLRALKNENELLKSEQQLEIKKAKDLRHAQQQLEILQHTCRDIEEDKVKEIRCISEKYGRLIHVLQNQRDQLQNEIELGNVQKKELENHVKELDHNYRKLEAQILEEKCKSEQYKRELLLLQNEREQFKSEYEHQAAKSYENVSKELEEKGKEIQELRKRLSSVDILKKETEEIKLKLEAEEKINKDLSAQMNKLNNLLQIGQDSLATGQETVNKLQSQLQAANQVIEDIKSELAKQKKINKDFSAQVAKLNSLLEIEQDSLAAEQEKIRKLQYQLQAANEAIDDMKSKLEEETQINDDFSIQVARLKSSVKTGQDALAVEQEAIKKLQKQLQAANQQLTNAKQMEDQVEALQNQIKIIYRESEDKRIRDISCMSEQDMHRRNLLVTKNENELFKEHQLIRKIKQLGDHVNKIEEEKRQNQIKVNHLLAELKTLKMFYDHFQNGYVRKCNEIMHLEIELQQKCRLLGENRAPPSKDNGMAGNSSKLLPPTSPKESRVQLLISENNRITQVLNAASSKHEHDKKDAHYYNICADFIKKGSEKFSDADKLAMSELMEEFQKQLLENMNCQFRDFKNDILKKRCTHESEREATQKVEGNEMEEILHTKKTQENYTAKHIQKSNSVSIPVTRALSEPNVSKREKRYIYDNHDDNKSDARSNCEQQLKGDKKLVKDLKNTKKSEGVWRMQATKQVEYVIHRLAEDFKNCLERAKKEFGEKASREKALATAECEKKILCMKTILHRERTLKRLYHKIIENYGMQNTHLSPVGPEENITCRYSVSSCP